MSKGVDMESGRMDLSVQLDNNRRQRVSWCAAPHTYVRPCCRPSGLVGVS